jgi:CheY-like chemotaxis protein
MHHPAARRHAAINEPPLARLLIVDDEQLVRELHARVLSLEGYEVETVEDGVAGLERLAEEHFDLVLTDRQMPKLDGVTMVLALRSAGSRIPVIMISGSLVNTPLPRAIAREVAAALPKPARNAEVLSAVAAALRLAPKRESLDHFRRANLLAA